MTAAWYYQLFGEVFGPVTWDSMVELATSGQLGQSDLVRDGEQAAGWQPADQVAGLFAAETASAESDLDQMLASNTDFVMNLSEGASPTATSAAVSTRETRWMCRVQNRDLGPFNLQALRDLVAEGTLTSNDLIRETHEQTWGKAKMLPGLFVGQVVRPRAPLPALEPEQVTPEAAAPHAQPSWYWKILGKELGPFTLEEFQQLIRRGELNEKHRVKQDGSNWTEAGRLVELFPPAERSFPSFAEETPPLEETPPEWETPAEAVAAPVPAPVKLSASKAAEPVAGPSGAGKSRTKKRGKEVDPLDYLMEPEEPVEESRPSRPALAVERSTAPAEAPAAPRPVPVPAVAARTPAPSAPPPPRPTSVNWSELSSAPKKSASFSNPFSGLGSLFSGMFSGGGGGVSSTQIALLAVCVLVLGGWFIPGLFGGDDGLVEETQSIYKKAEELMSKKAADGEWQKLADEVKPVVQERTKELTKATGTPIRQMMLYCYRDHLPIVLKGPAKEREASMKLMQDLLGRAHEILTSPTTAPPPADTSTTAATTGTAS